MAERSLREIVVPVGFCGEQRQSSAAPSICGRIASAVGMKLFSAVASITICSASVQMRVVIVVPGRHRVDHFIPRVDQRPEQRNRSAACPRLPPGSPPANSQLFPVFHKCGDGLPQVQIAFRCGIIGEMLPVCIDDPIFQFLRDGKDRRVEIPYGKVVNFFPPADLFADLAAKFDNFRPDQGFGKMG